MNTACSKPVLVPIAIRRRTYPAAIFTSLLEVKAGFSTVDRIDTACDYCLHTEHAFGYKELPEMPTDLPALRRAVKDNVPMLWVDDEWALQFADFVARVVGIGRRPRVVELHPPFKTDSESGLRDFVGRIGLFVDRLSNRHCWTDVTY